MKIQSLLATLMSSSQRFSQSLNNLRRQAHNQKRSTFRWDHLNSQKRAPKLIRNNLLVPLSSRTSYWHQTLKSSPGHLPRSGIARSRISALHRTSNQDCHSSFRNRVEARVVRLKATDGAQLRRLSRSRHLKRNSISQNESWKKSRSFWLHNPLSLIQPLRYVPDCLRNKSKNNSKWSSCSFTPNGRHSATLSPETV
jgi:uncharacterized protein YoaH (UPF0181 family)